MDEKAIGRNIKALLDRRGMTRRDLAAKVNMNEVTVGRYISGRRTPDALTLLAIANALECEVGRLLIGAADGEAALRDLLKMRVINGMETKGFLINEQTDGLIPVSVELVTAKDMFHVRLHGQSVTISLYAEDVRKMFEGSGQP